MFKIKYHEKFPKDVKKLKLTKKQMISLKTKLEEVAEKPYPKSEGGLGESLRNNLFGFLKFRFDENYRVVYRLVIKDEVMSVIIVGMRKDKEVYKEVQKRIK